MAGFPPTVHGPANIACQPRKGEAGTLRVWSASHLKKCVINVSQMGVGSVYIEITKKPEESVWV